MKKLIFVTLISIIGVAMSGCSEDVTDLDLKQDGLKTEMLSRSSVNVNPGLVYFDSVTAPELWIQHETIFEMLDALDLPESLINTLTTAQLVECCINYPLSINYFLHDNPEDGISSVIEGFNGFKALQKRDDYAQEILNYYGKAVAQSSVLQRKANLTMDDADKKMKSEYIGAIILSNYFPKVMEGEALQQLKKIISTKSAFATGNHGETKCLSTDVDTRLYNLIIDGQNPFPKTDGYGYAFFYTYFGSPIELFTNVEKDATELAKLEDDAKRKYTNAVMLAPASNRYNCHFYAWMSENSEIKLWMNDKKRTGEPNVKLFWSNDEYYPANQNNFQKLCYEKDGNIHHSAIKSTVSGMVDSKWADGPLMRHSPDYCPYASGTTKKHYKRYDISGPLQTSYGQGATTVGKIDTYYIDDSRFNVPISRMTWSLSIETSKGDDAIANGTAKVHAHDQGNAQIEFTKAGLYNITLDGYSKYGQRAATYGFEAIVEM